jgi:hypothetical protein
VGGGGDFENNFLQGYSEQNKYRHALTNWREKYPAPVFRGEKMLENSVVAGIDLTSPSRRSAGLIFRD